MARLFVEISFDSFCQYATYAQRQIATRPQRCGGRKLEIVFSSHNAFRFLHDGRNRLIRPQADQTADEVGKDSKAEQVVVVFRTNLRQLALQPRRLLVILRTGTAGDEPENRYSSEAGKPSGAGCKAAGASAQHRTYEPPTARSKAAF